MGTMIQKRKLNERDFRGKKFAKNKINLMEIMIFLNYE